MRSPLRSPAQVDGPQGVPPQPEKDLERPSSTRLEARFPYHDSRAMTRSPRHSHGDPTSLAPHERLTDLAVVPREKSHTGAAAREHPRDHHSFPTRRSSDLDLERPSSTRLEARVPYCREPAFCILSAYCILPIECSTFHSIIFQDLE